MTDRPRCIVVLASANIRVRRRWKQALKEMFDIHECAVRTDLRHAIFRFRPSILLLDSALADSSVVRNLSIIQRLSPSTKTIVLTASPEEKGAILAVEAGARGYCSSEIDSVLLIKAIEMVQKDEIWVGRNVMSQLLKKMMTQDAQPLSIHPGTHLDYLTKREREIALLIRSGATNKEIAQRLGITEATVKSHLTVIFRKLGIADRLGLALYISKEDSTSR